MNGNTKTICLCFQPRCNDIVFFSLKLMYSFKFTLLNIIIFKYYYIYIIYYIILSIIAAAAGSGDPAACGCGGTCISTTSVVI